MPQVVVLGVFVADCTFRGERLPRMGETLMGKSFALGPGGKGSNQAVACARLGTDTRMLTKLGQDDFASLALNTWKEAGVTPHVTQDASSYTGSACIFIEDASGDNAIVIAPGAAATLSPADIEAARDLIAEADVFVTQLEQPMPAAMRGLELARAAGVTTILNPAPAADLPAGMLALCDYVTPNETECEALTGITVTTTEGTQIRDLGGKNHYVSHSPLEEHFGLRSATTADITVRWPDGSTTEMRDVAADQRITIAHRERS